MKRNPGASKAMSRSSILPLFVLCSAAAVAAAPSFPPELPDPELTQRLEELTRGFGGDVGVYVRHLPTGRSAAVRADVPYPAASLIKVPILLALFDRIERGELHYHTRLTWRAAEREPSGGLIASLRDGSTVDVRLLAYLMVTISENDASLWCQELAGGGAGVNRWLEKNGFPLTRVNSRTAGRELDRARFGWGQSSPREMAEMLLRLRERRAVSPAADDEMTRLLGNNYYNDVALSVIPPYVNVLSKTGGVRDARSEAVLVEAPSGPFVFAVLTRGQHDQRGGLDNEAYVLIRAVTRLLWQRFEPGSTWTPPEIDRFR
jgi:beta-lactamase class A